MRLVATRLGGAGVSPDSLPRSYFWQIKGRMARSTNIVLGDAAVRHFLISWNLDFVVIFY